MRVQRTTAVLVAVVALLPGGCRLPGRDWPVSRSLATCRELSRQGIAGDAGPGIADRLVDVVAVAIGHGEGDKRLQM